MKLSGEVSCTAFFESYIHVLILGQKTINLLISYQRELACMYTYIKAVCFKSRMKTVK